MWVGVCVRKGEREIERGDGRLPEFTGMKTVSSAYLPTITGSVFVHYLLCCTLLTGHMGE